MTKNFTLRYYETFEYHSDEYHEEEYDTVEEVKEAVSNLCYSTEVRDVSVSANFTFEDFYIEAWEMGLN